MTAVTWTRAEYPPAHAQWLASVTASSVSMTEVRAFRVVTLIHTWQEWPDAEGVGAPNVTARLTAMDETGAQWVIGATVRSTDGNQMHDLLQVTSLGTTCEEATANALRLASAWGSPSPVEP